QPCSSQAADSLRGLDRLALSPREHHRPDSRPARTVADLLEWQDRWLNQDFDVGLRCRWPLISCPKTPRATFISASAFSRRISSAPLGENGACEYNGRGQDASATHEVPLIWHGVPPRTYQRVARKDAPQWSGEGPWSEGSRGSHHPARPR